MIVFQKYFLSSSINPLNYHNIGPDIYRVTAFCHTVHSLVVLKDSMSA